jgi:hypothetical protein
MHHVLTLTLCFTHHKGVNSPWQKIHQQVAINGSPKQKQIDQDKYTINFQILVRRLATLGLRGIEPCQRRV